MEENRADEPHISRQRKLKILGCSVRAGYASQGVSRQDGRGLERHQARGRRGGEQAGAQLGLMTARRMQAALHGQALCDGELR